MTDPNLIQRAAEMLEASKNTDGKPAGIVSLINDLQWKLNHYRDGLEEVVVQLEHLTK